MAANPSQPSFEFAYDTVWYTVQGAETWLRTATKQDLKEMRAEYTRMRDTAQKRIKRLGKEFPESKVYQEHRQGFKKLKDMDKRDFAKAFADLAKFLKAKSSTVTGQKQIKQKTIKTWQDQGLDLTDKNYKQAIDILEQMRSQKLVYGSDSVVDLANEMVKLEDPNQKGEWLDNLAKLLPHADEIGDALSEYEEGTSISEIIDDMGW